MTRTNYTRLDATKVWNCREQEEGKHHYFVRPLYVKFNILAKIANSYFLRLV